MELEPTNSQTRGEANAICAYVMSIMYSNLNKPCIQSPNATYLTLLNFLSSQYSTKRRMPIAIQMRYTYGTIEDYKHAKQVKQT